MNASFPGASDTLTPEDETIVATVVEAAVEPAEIMSEAAPDMDAELDQTEREEKVEKPAKPAAPAKPEKFAEGDYVVYPTHGVGKVERIAIEEIAGHKLELIHITFEENRMTLRVPVAKARSAGLRKLATRKLFDEALAVLKGRARIKRTMWSRRAQEYEAKINSGDPLAIAEVVRDLHRNAGQPDQSFSRAADLRGGDGPSGRRTRRAGPDRQDDGGHQAERLPQDAVTHWANKKGGDHSPPFFVLACRAADLCF